MERNMGNTRIWKYCGKTSNGTKMSLQSAGGIIGVVSFVLVGIIGLSALFIFMSDKIGAAGGRLLLTVGIIVLVIPVVVVCSRLGKTAGSMQRAFVRDSDGKLYMFDYLSTNMGYNNAGNSLLRIIFDGKRMNEIDKAKVLESIVDAGEINLYAREIFSVQKIEENKGYCKIYCALKDANGVIKDTIINISCAYQDYDELLRAINYVQWNSSFDKSRVKKSYEKISPKLALCSKIFLILTIAGSIGMIGSRVYINNIRSDYQMVQVSVIDVRENVGFGGTTHTEVTVEYQGQCYQLQKVTRGSFYYESLMIFIFSGVVWLVVFFSKKDYEKKMEDYP